MIALTESDFQRLASEGYNRIPVTLETYADLDTPLSIYLKLANQPYSYLLESVQGGERFGRYSFIGLAASTRIAVIDDAILLLPGRDRAGAQGHGQVGWVFLRFETEAGHVVLGIVRTDRAQQAD